MLFGNNNLVWKFQLYFLVFLVETSISSSIVCYSMLLLFFAILIAFINIVFLLFFFERKGSLSLMVLRRIKLESIFKIVFLRINTFSLTLVITKVLS